ncbi:hypothetical protein [Spirillospora sp. NPDC047279]|uniref:hypothetical protein n=1 Tax=Spirillospora sp. NPDC047279 TaxID=3155478 RepID=UPI0033E9BA27
MVEVPAPSPEMVKAARRHLAGRFARGLDELLWEETKQPLSDGEAVHKVLAAADRGEELSGPDLAAALVVMQARQLDGDRLEYRLFMLARAHGLELEQIAAVLDLEDAAAAQARLRHLTVRAGQPVAEVEAPSLRGPGSYAERASKAGQRADQAARRARQAARRRSELSGEARSSSSDSIEKAELRAGHAHEHAEQAHRNAVLALLRSAEAYENAAALLDRAAETADLEDPTRAADLQRRADTCRAQARRSRTQADQLS